MTRNHQNDQVPKETNKQTGISSIGEAYRILSSRESKILYRLLEGLSNKEIADALDIIEKTVENHITRIGKKLSVRGRGTLRRWLTNLKHRGNGSHSTPQNNEGRE